MKILQVLHFFLPRHSAGTEVYTDRLSRGLQQRHDVELFFSEKIHSLPDGALVQREQEGLPCHVFVNNLLYDSFAETFDHAVAEQRFDEVLDRVQPDVVHVQHLMLLSMGLVKRAAARGIPVVMTLHDFWLFCPRMGQLLHRSGERCEGPEPSRCAECMGNFKFAQSSREARWIRWMASARQRLGVDLSPWVERAKRWPRPRRKGGAPAPDHSAVSAEDVVRRRETVTALAQHVRQFVSPSKTVRDFAVSHGLPADRILHLPNGFEPLSGAPRTIPTPAGGPRLRVGFLGTPAPHKGVHVLIDGFVQAKLRDAELKIYGTPRYYPDYYRTLKERSKGASVEFCGAVPRSLVLEVLGKLDLLVVPSIWLENAPVVIQEARWAGIPVMASDLGGMAEAVVHDQDGWLFRPGDSQHLAEGLRRVDDRRELLKQWAEAAPLPMTMEQHLEKMEAVYESVRQPP